MSKPRPTHYTLCEGGTWISFEEARKHSHLLSQGRASNNVHAIKFEDGSILDMFNGWRKDPSWGMKLLLEHAIENFEKLSPQQQAAHRYEQKRSFVRGMCPSDRDYKEWCKYVDELLPPDKGTT